MNGRVDGEVFDIESSWLVTATQGGITQPLAVFLDEEAALCFCLDHTCEEVEYGMLAWDGSGWSVPLPS